MRPFVGTVLLTLTFLGTLAGALFLQNKGIKAVRTNPPFYETWQLAGRSGEVMKVLALRYDQVMADFLWLRAIQSFGGRGMTNRDWKPLYNQFEAITELDPYFAEAYTFGHLVIGDEGGQQREGLKLLEKGTFKVFRQYRIPFEGMYVAHWELRDHNLARWFGRIASKRADAPDWTHRITAYIDVEAGEYYVGFDRFVGNLLTALDAKEPLLQDIAISKLKETIDKWNVSILGQALDEYTTSTGQIPTSVEQLAGQPALQEYEVASMSKLVAAVQRRARDLGHPGIDPRFAANMALPTQSELQLATPQTTETAGATTLIPYQNEIFQESLVKANGLPEEPYGKGYTLNQAMLGRPGAKPEDVIVREEKLKEFTHSLLQQLRSIIFERHKDLGRFPRDLDETFLTEFKTKEPSGGEWLYNPENGEIRSSVHPDL